MFIGKKYTISYFIVLYLFWDIQRWIMACPWNLGYGWLLSAIVNTALSSTIFNFLDVEEYCDLEIQVKGNLRLSETPTFDSLHTSSYPSSIVTFDDGRKSWLFQTRHLHNNPLGENGCENTTWPTRRCKPCKQILERLSLRLSILHSH